MVLVDGIFNILSDLVLNGGHLMIFFLMFLEGALTPIPSEAIMAPAGYLVSQGQLSFMGVMISSTLGVLAGTLLTYFIGLYGGRKFIDKYGKYFLLKDSFIERSESYFKKHGTITIFTCRFVPAVRQVISLPAGWSKMKLETFITYTAIGSAMWNFILLYFSYALGEKWTLIGKYSKPLDIALIVIIAIVVVLYVRNGKKK